jgi:hypothetical protein
MSENKTLPERNQVLSTVITPETVNEIVPSSSLFSTRNLAKIYTEQQLKEVVKKETSVMRTQIDAQMRSQGFTPVDTEKQKNKMKFGWNKLKQIATMPLFVSGKNLDPELYRDDNYQASPQDVDNIGTEDQVESPRMVSKALTGILSFSSGVIEKTKQKVVEFKDGLERSRELANNKYEVYGNLQKNIREYVKLEADLNKYYENILLIQQDLADSHKSLQDIYNDGIPNERQEAEISMIKGMQGEYTQEIQDMKVGFDSTLKHLNTIDLNTPIKAATDLFDYIERQTPGYLAGEGKNSKLVKVMQEAQALVEKIEAGKTDEAFQFISMNPVINKEDYQVVSSFVQSKKSEVKSNIDSGLQALSNNEAIPNDEVIKSNESQNQSLQTPADTFETNPKTNETLESIFNSSSKLPEYLPSDYLDVDDNEFLFLLSPKLDDQLLNAVSKVGSQFSEGKLTALFNYLENDGENEAIKMKILNILSSIEDQSNQPIDPVISEEISNSINTQTSELTDQFEDEKSLDQVFADLENSEEYDTTTNFNSELVNQSQRHLLQVPPNREYLFQEQRLEVGDKSLLKFAITYPYPVTNIPRTEVIEFEVNNNSITNADQNNKINLISFSDHSINNNGLLKETQAFKFRLSPFSPFIKIKMHKGLVFSVEFEGNSSTSLDLEIIKPEKILEVSSNNVEQSKKEQTEKEKAEISFGEMVKIAPDREYIMDYSKAMSFSIYDPNNLSNNITSFSSKKIGIFDFYNINKFKKPNVEFGGDKEEEFTISFSEDTIPVTITTNNGSIVSIKTNESISGKNSLVYLKIDTITSNL